MDFDVVVSFATYSLRTGGNNIYQFLDSIVNQRYRGRFHVVANLWQPDYENSPKKLKYYFKKHGIEVHISETNYKTFLKSCYSFEKFNDVPIITVDDDQVYSNNTVQLLMDTHRKFPNAVVAGLCKIQGVDDNHQFLKFDSQPWVMSGTKPGYRGTRAIGSGGILYPSEFHNKITMDDISNWIENNPQPQNRYNDDLFIYEMCVKHHTYVMPVIAEPVKWNGYLVKRTLHVNTHDGGTWRMEDKV